MKSLILSIVLQVLLLHIVKMCILCKRNKNNNKPPLTGLVVLETCLRVRTIPVIDGLKTLICHSSRLKILPVIDGLEKLDCSYTSISEIPYIESLNTIKCLNCCNLVKVPYIKSVYYLNLTNCRNINEIPEEYATEVQKSIETQRRLKKEGSITQKGFILDHGLDVLKLARTNINTIPHIKTLSVLDVSGTNIRKIPNLPLLKRLTCCNTNIKRIPSFRKLETLTCSDCQILTTIPIIDSLRDLCCNSCTNITSLPEILCLEKLRCCGTGITEIPVLEGTNDPSSHGLRIINCSETNIKTIPHITGLHELSCYGCRNLTHIPYIKGLYKLNIQDTCVTSIPCKYIIDRITIDVSKWIYPETEDINKIITLQKWFRESNRHNRLMSRINVLFSRRIRIHKG